ncbi:hypothetical protein ACWD64_36950 [Streptomyces antibioticus]
MCLRIGQQGLVAARRVAAPQPAAAPSVPASATDPMFAVQSVVGPVVGPTMTPTTDFVARS